MSKCILSVKKENKKSNIFREVKVTPTPTTQLNHFFFYYFKSVYIVSCQSKQIEQNFFATILVIQNFVRNNIDYFNFM